MGVFCSSLMSFFSGMFLRYFLNDLKVVAVVCIINGISFVVTLHIHAIYVVRCLIS
jgi:hypothetical protein